MRERYEALSEMQQKAVRVLAACALAILATLIITIVAVKLTAGPSAKVEEGDISEEYDQDAYALDHDSVSIMESSEDAGENYLKETLFVGDSNTVRMYNYGLIGLQQFVGMEGLGIQGVTSTPCVYFTDSSNAYTIPQAIGMMKPRRIVVIMGTNNVNGNMSADEFISEYRNALNTIRSSYGYCEIIIAAIPPVPANHSNYPDIKMQLIDEFNQALLKMCEQDGYKFLNTSELLKGDNGFGKSNYFASNDIHYSKEGIEALLKYVRTHASSAQDARPDTSNIPTRAQNPVSTADPASSEVAIKANYYVEGDGGYIDTGVETVQSASFDVKETDSITVTAVPKEGYVFLKWSDGVTSATRTDKNFKQSLSVTAMFNAATYNLTLDKTSASIKAGESVSLKATVTQGNQAVSANSVIWTVNDEQEATASTFNCKFKNAGTYKIVAYYHVSSDKTISAECQVTVEAAEEDYKVSIVGPSTVVAGAGGTYTVSIEPAVEYSVIWYVNGAEVSKDRTFVGYFGDLGGQSCTVGARVDTYGTVKVTEMTVNVQNPPEQPSEPDDTENGDEGEQQ